MTATELKPCPFCGGEAKVNTLKWAGGYTATALCKNEPNAHYLNTWDEDEEKAIGRIIEAWNRRAERTCKWTPADYITEGDWWNTECGESITWEPDGVPNYCPNCGAKVVDA